MFKNLAISVILLCSLNSFGQISDTLNKKGVNHFVGVQANALLKQLFNLSNNNTNPANPYVLTYAFISKKNGWGAHIGLGYESKKIKDVLSPSNKISKSQNLAVRVGVEKRITLGKKFSASFGFDCLKNNTFSSTNSTNVTNIQSGIDSSISVVNSSAKGYGAGFQLGINYAVTEKILLGTETSYYFMKENERENSTTTSYLRSFFQGQSNSASYTNSNTELKTKKFGLNLPVVIYLIIKL